MVSIFSLPADVFRYHIVSFICLKDLANLDSSLVNDVQRKSYLEKVQFYEFSDIGALELDEDIADWLISRKIQVKNIKCSIELPGQKLIRLGQNMVGTTHLDLSHCTSITDWDVCYIAAFCTNLRSLSVAFCSHITAQALEVVFSNATKLEYVNVSGLKETCHLLTRQFLVNLTSNLTTFLCNGTFGMNDTALTIIASKCPNLRILDVGNCPKITDESIMAVATHCTRLEQLSVEGCDEVSSRSIESIAKQCSRLVELNVSYTFDVEQLAFTAIASHCFQLRSLSLCKMTDADDASVCTIVRNCVMLEVLLLAHTLITDIALYAIARNLPFLEHLDISDNEGFTTDAICSVLRSRGATLTTIHLNNVPGLSHEVLVACANCCPNLHTVSLKNMRHCAHIALVTFALAARKLQSLCLTGCRSVRDMAVLILASTCPDLMYLDLSYCPQITDAILLPLVTQCTKLKSLVVTHCPLVTMKAVDDAVQLTYASIER